MRVYLGVDGGGTKTALCLVGADGAVLATAVAPGCYYLGAEGPGSGLVETVLGAAVPALCADAGIAPADIAYAFLGLPGYGEVADDVPALDDAVGRVLGHQRYQCANDMVCGWAGSLGGADGINVIAGTGSMAYGRRAGHEARVGGWSELFGDEGSGHWIGQRALTAFSRMSDGRCPAGPLLRLVRERLGLAEDLELIDLALNRWTDRRREVAALSVVVVEAARAGDDRARAILEDAAGELVDLVAAAHRRLGYAAGEPVPVSYSGGVFGAAEVREAFSAGLRAAVPGVDLRSPLLTPVAGAALLAAGAAGAPLTRAAMDRLVAATREGRGPAVGAAG